MKLLLAAFVALHASAQEAPKKKPAVKKQQASHTKATPEQIRKFNQLEKKQQKK
jgi:hypothetical protein